MKAFATVGVVVALHGGMAGCGSDENSGNKDGQGGSGGAAAGAAGSEPGGTGATGGVGGQGGAAGTGGGGAAGTGGGGAAGTGGGGAAGTGGGGGSSTGATRVYYQDFDTPSQVESFWLNNSRGSKALVSAQDGAEILRGNCLRGNWAYCYKDPITNVEPNCESYDRYSGYELHVDIKGIRDEMYMDYWTRIDADAQKAYGVKWIWFQGNYKIPGEYGNAFNPIVTAPWSGWNTWMVNGNNTVGETGGLANDRDVQIKDIPGIKALRGTMSVDEWFQGRWHHFQVYAKLNSPVSSSNGIIRVWIDGVLIMDFDDYRWRDVDVDEFSHVVTPMMYGGGDPPPGPFGWQLDEIAIWDGMPPAP